MSNVYKILPHYTYDDWVQWEGRWELIEGHPIAMTPAPVPRHQAIVAFEFQMNDNRKITPDFSAIDFS